MKTYTRYELDTLAANSGLVPVLAEDGDSLLVNGMLGEYTLWVKKNDESLTPCLKGDVGGMPGAWENWVTAWHTANLSAYDVYVDLGANVGYFASLAASRGLWVVAVEPNPEYAALIRKTRAENQFEEFFVIEAAVSSQSGESTLNIPANLDGSATLVVHKHLSDVREVTVPVVTLDDVELPIGSDVLIKMDIEGYEEQAFLGAVEMNKTFKPTYILEYSPGSYSENFLPALCEYGRVSIVTIDGSDRPVTDIDFQAKDWITLVVRPH